MQYIAKSTDLFSLKTSCLIVPVFAKKLDLTSASMINDAENQKISAILKLGDFQGNNGQTQIHYDFSCCNAQRVLLLGLGNKRDFSKKSFKTALSSLMTTLDDSKCRDFSVVLSDFAELDAYQSSREIILAINEIRYQFNQCKSLADDKTYALKKVTFITDDRKSQALAQKSITHTSAIANGISLAKDLSNLPGNICTPTYLADQAKSIARQYRKIKTTILEEKQMEKLGMGSFLSVSRGSRQPAKLITMEYKGGKVKDKPVVLVGKGLTFDAGGISLKPGAGMDEMKYDMCGSASVFGTITAAADMDLPINIVGIVPSSENMPDGDANKPGDIVTSMSGQTIEILNTDAEGRLILCDALTYAEKFNPAIVIDIATLTGACIIALGHQTNGLMANDDKLANDLLDAGETSGDRTWRLPLWDEYQSQLDSNFADIANIGGRGAGTITAACFLSRFTKKYKWAHLDIAGTAWKSGKEKGATGRPVTLLSQLLLKRARQV